MASNVGRSSTAVRLGSGNVAGTCTLPLPRYHRVKLPPTI
jgi:hypothetical protein